MRPYPHTALEPLMLSQPVLVLTQSGLMQACGYLKWWAEWRCYSIYRQWKCNICSLFICLIACLLKHVVSRQALRKGKKQSKADFVVIQAVGLFFCERNLMLFLLNEWLTAAFKTTNQKHTKGNTKFLSTLLGTFLSCQPSILLLSCALGFSFFFCNEWC